MNLILTEVESYISEIGKQSYHSISSPITSYKLTHSHNVIKKSNDNNISKILKHSVYSNLTRSEKSVKHKLKSTLPLLLAL